MTVAQYVQHGEGSRHLSFEVLPPLKGTGIDRLFSTIDKLKDFNPFIHCIYLV